MEQNRFRTYIFYAIGEIALVMVGILLALQVNNWNEERKVAENRLSFLIALSEEIESNVSALQEYEVEVRTWSDATHNYLQIMTADETPEDSLIANLAGVIGPVWKREISSSAVINLVRSGSLELIEDKDLKQSILLIPTYYENFDNNIKTAQDQWVDLFRPYYQKHSNLLAMWEEVDGYTIPKFSYDVDKGAFHQNMIFTNMLVTRLRFVTNLRRTTEGTASLLNSLNESINDKINELNQ